MSQLEKATLQAISSDEAATPLGDPIPVQFNPTSLRLQITNSTEGGESRGRQVRQYNGSSSTTLNLELIFDTADEGSTGSPRSVREKTQLVEQFVYPQGEGDKKQAPPKLRFQWGDLILEGVVDNISIDLDHFAPSGVPLRAKVGFSFKEQDRRYEFLEKGPGANAGSKPPSPGLPSLGAVGSIGLGVSAQVGLSIGGESAAEFAARVGVDPEAWRGLSLDGAASFSLDAGLEIGFSAGLSASAGLGVSVGASAGASVSLDASFGLSAEAGVTTVAEAGANARLQQGFTLAAAGGVSSAVESVKIGKQATSVQQTKAAFSAPASSSSGGGALATSSTSSAVGSNASGNTATMNHVVSRPAMPEQKRTPLSITGVPSPASLVASMEESAPPPPKADRRSGSFGFGVPLRQQLGSSSRTRPVSPSGTVTRQSSQGAGMVPVTNDPTTPGWIALPASDPSRVAADRAQKRRRPAQPCGCSRPCGH